jgi:hypothetical protein
MHPPPDLSFRHVGADGKYAIKIMAVAMEDQYLVENAVMEVSLGQALMGAARMSAHPAITAALEYCVSSFTYCLARGRLCR